MTRAGAPGGAGLRNLALEAVWLSGSPLLLGRLLGGAGVILRFTRVRPPPPGFHPDIAAEITPRQLDRLLRALRRWGLDLVAMDEAMRRLATPGARRFAVLSFDGGYRDLVQHALPVLKARQAPFIAYLPTGFVDGIAPMWWLLLADVIGRHARISLRMEGNDHHFAVDGRREKLELHGALVDWMRGLSPDQRAEALTDLGRRYGSDAMALTRAAALGWDDVQLLAAEPLATLGSATVHYPALATLKDAAALREISMGRQVLEAALGRPAPHLAYPFGDAAAVGRRITRLAEQAGFASAATAQPRVVARNAAPEALPRLSYDRRRSLRALRVLVAGIGGEGAAR
jgi:peptidoglycan/xylan/chitin deacetylase (PgdA/CDA1 family)